MTDLRMEVLRLGGKLDGFTHWRVSSSSKPSDPDDVAWECACGLCRAPEHIERHWKAELATPERPRRGCDCPGKDFGSGFHNKACPFREAEGFA